MKIKYSKYSKEICINQTINSPYLEEDFKRNNRDMTLVQLFSYVVIFWGKKNL